MSKIYEKLQAIRKQLNEVEVLTNVLEKGLLLVSDELKTETEIRVYVIDVSNTPDIRFYLSDEEFMDEAERQGMVFTLPIFAQYHNTELKVNQINNIIRFIEVPINL
jgi:hemolysin activation/secretion protein